MVIYLLSVCERTLIIQKQKYKNGLVFLRGKLKRMGLLPMLINCDNSFFRHLSLFFLLYTIRA